jgi:hypothetical protein
MSWPPVATFEVVITVALCAVLQRKIQVPLAERGTLVYTGFGHPPFADLQISLSRILKTSDIRTGNGLRCASECSM